MNRQVSIGVLAAGLWLSAGLGHAAAQGSAELEKALIANEKAIVGAVAKGDAATFQKHIGADSWSIDPGGRMPVSEFVKVMNQLKITASDLTEFKVLWVSPDTAVVTYKWTGKGTFMGQAIAPMTWSSTVWTKRNAAWVAVFHQETVPDGPPPAK